MTLVDGDLRRPRIAETLGVEGAVGLTSVLIGHTTLDQAVQRWGPERLSVLTSGPIPSNPSELLASQHMAGLLAELASRCDGALLIIRHGKTPGSRCGPRSWRWRRSPRD